jgi:hypothetical protein
VPESVGPPEAGSTERRGRVTVFFEESVSAVHREAVLRGLDAGQAYVADPLGGFRFNDPICVDVRAAVTDSNTVGAVYGANHIVLYTGARPLVGSPSWLLPHVTAHELIHFWQKDIGSPRDGAGPMWLLEGAAELLAYQAVIGAGLATPADTRAYSLRRVEPDTPSLQSMERRASDPSQFSYPLSFLAVELLVGDGAPAALREYWRGLARGKAWEVSFAEAFAITPTEFYARFEEYRRHGFR